MSIFVRPRVLIAAGSSLLMVIAGVVVTAPAVPAAPAAPVAGDQTSKTARPWQTGVSSGPVTTKPVAQAEPREVLQSGEIPSLRTRSSNTFYGDDGQMKSVFSTMPVNYHLNNQWLPIDESLVPSGTGFKNTADSTAITVPGSADGPFVSMKDGLSILSTLTGAAASPAEVSGSSATYVGAYPSVDVKVTALPDALEQSYVLHDSSAQHSFAATVTLTTGASLRGQPDGSIAILGAQGASVAAIPVPVLHDASTNPDTSESTAAHYTLTGSAPTYTVMTTIDDSWLSDPARVFPVELDPSSTFGTSLDTGCYVASPGAPDPVVCSTNSGTDNVLSYGSTAYIRHVYMTFGDLTGSGSPIPVDAIVSSAALQMTEKTAVNSNSMDTSIYEVSGTWGTGITWSTQPANSGSQYDHVTVSPPGVNAVNSFFVTGMVNNWVHGQATNNGLELRLTSDAVSNSLTYYGFVNAKHPSLVVNWQQPVGQQKWVGAYDHRLSDRLDLHVDYGTRNLVINDLDEQLQGPGQSLTVRRTYNSLVAVNSVSNTWPTTFGPGWTTNGGTDAGLFLDRSAVRITQPGGAQAIFDRDFSVTNLALPTAFIPAPGLNAHLAMPDSTHYTLTFDQTGTVYRYTLTASGAFNGYLSSVTDSKGNAITYTATATPPVTNTITDTTGSRLVTMSYTSGVATGMTETLVSGTPRSWSYTYDGSGRLSTATDAAGKVTRYCYSGSTNLLSKLITPRGSASGATCATTAGTDVTDIAYDSDGHVTSVSYENGASSAITVTFATQTALTLSTKGVTRFTDPFSQHTDYTYDSTDAIRMTVDPLANTTTSKFNTNNDVITSVSANNYTGGTMDSATTNTFDPSNIENLTGVALPTGASASLAYTNASQPNRPNSITGDLGTDVSSRTMNNTTGDYTSISQGAATVNILHEGDSGVSHCGPSGAAAFAGAVCQTQDADWTSGAQHRTLYSYDSLGELTSITPPTPVSTAPAAETIAYDGYSRPISVVNSKADTTGYHYDALDRLTKIDVPGGGTVEYVYDEDGNLQSQTDYNSSHVSQNYDNYTYDNLNRTTQQVNWTNGTANLTWDGNSRLLTYSDAGGTITYAYDAAGGLTSLTEPSGSCTGYSISGTRPSSSSGCFLFQLDKSGHRLETVHPGDVGDEKYTYDTSGRVTAIVGYTSGDSGGATKTFDYGFSYSSTGVPGGTDQNHITRRTDNTTSGYVNYTYTNEDRLSSALTKNSGGTTTASLTYCYDKNANLTLSSTTIGATCPGTATFAYNGANETSTQPFGSHNTFDADGNSTDTDSAATGSNTRQQTSYSRGDQTSTFTIGAGSALTQTSFGIDNTERLDSFISSTDDQAILNTPLGITASTRSHSGTPQNPKYYTRDPQGNLLAMRLGSTHYYYQTDNQQSVLRLLDSTGTVKDTYSYTPYGQATATINTVQPFTYTSAWTEDFSGLLKLGARYYDPTQTRFTQPDPQTHPGDINQSSPYPYAGDDPINHIDPTGQGFGSIIGAGIGTVIGGIAAAATCTATAGIGCFAAFAIYGSVLPFAGGLIGAGIANETYDPQAELLGVPGAVALAFNQLQE